MNHRLIDSGESAKWNQFVSDSPKSHIFQSYEWGEAASHHGWMPLRVVIEEGDDIKACISLLKRKIRTTPWSILYCPRGPVIEFKDENILDRLMNAIHQIAASHRAIFLQINPQLFDGDRAISERLTKRGFVKREKFGLFRLMQPEWVYRVDVRQTEKELLDRMKSKTRYNIKLAAKKGIEIVEKQTIEDLHKFYDILKKTSARKKFALRGFSYFQAIWQEMVPNGLATLFFATYKGERLAGVLVFIFGNMCWYMYGASDDKYRNLMPSYALHWYVIQWAQKKGCAWYDLRGVPSFNPPSGHSGYGVYRFKKGFGGDPYTFLGDFYFIYKPRLYACWEKGEAVLNRFGKLLLKFFSG
jgi:lipid II:glycine glycyltransferase (peptidoglycan interpeptide bridge formation enzyme)